jgi:hypothetical protein
MTSYLKVVLSAAGVTALLASPVMAKTVHHGMRTPAAAYGRVQALPPAPPPPAAHAFVTPYGADVPQPAHSGSVNPDFQVPGNNH